VFRNQLPQALDVPHRRTGEAQRFDLRPRPDFRVGNPASAQPVILPAHDAKLVGVRAHGGEPARHFRRELLLKKSNMNRDARLAVFAKYFGRPTLATSSVVRTNVSTG
jgi:hypothetical protein